MYASFILHMICHSLRRVRNFQNNSLEQFPPTINTALQQLKKTAFDGLIKDKIVFTVEELPVICKYDPTCYGLLQSTESYSAEEYGSPTKSFNFLHLGIQEYFAAKYVTTLPEDEVNTLLKKSFIVADELFYHDNSTVRLSNMWILYCGITSGQCKTLRHYLATYGDPISTTEIISQSILKDQSNVLYLFQCFQEAQDVALCKVLSKSFDNGVIDISEHSLLPYQVVSLGHFLSISDQQKLKELNLSKCYIGDHGMSKLHRYICVHRDKEQEIIEVNLSYNDLTGPSLPLIVDIISHLQVHTLLLHNNNFTNMRDISTAVIDSSTVKVLGLDVNGITAEVAAIYDMMICLEKLCMYKVNKLAEVLSKGITNTTTLRVLHINNVIKLSKITATTNALVNNSSLEELTFNDNDKLAMRITRSLHQNITKFELPNLIQSYDDVINISEDILPYQVESLGFFLSKSHRTKWRQLYLPNCHIGDHGMSILHQYLCGDDKADKLEITEVDLSENNLTGASSPLIADIINHLQVHTLLLHNNDIPNVRDISTAVIDSSTVKVLGLDVNGITAEVAAIYDMMICLEKLCMYKVNKLSYLEAEVLSKGITNTKTLRVLHINNVIELSKITAITNALVNNSSLEELTFNDNDKLAMRITRSLHQNITKFELPNLIQSYDDVINISEDILPYQVEFLGFFLL